MSTTEPSAARESIMLWAICGLGAETALSGVGLQIAFCLVA
ncbi:MAG: hypothetical protein QHJ82_14535 [Verrucomicrobiota bacterium]|nr:hypothetical protein [Verrucomicrobiota bacterium]